jgi:YebC/PmpR family DNA-binding regulatory protein
MAGHSKWKNIKHKKEKEDSLKAKAFTRIAKEIMVVARDGGPDPAHNAKLRLLIEKARDANMPKDNIERAIKKGSGQLEGCNYEQIIYEGCGPYGTAVMIETLSDNRNRTVSELRHYFNKHGGSLAETGAISWMFEHKGVVEIAMGGKTEDEILELLLNCDADDIKFEPELLVQAFCQAKELDSTRKKIEDLGLLVKATQIIWQAKEPVQFSNEELEATAVQFIDGLEELDDVQNVYTNF